MQCTRSKLGALQQKIPGGAAFKTSDAAQNLSTTAASLN